VLDAVAENVDDSALDDLALEAVEELIASQAGRADRKFLDDLRLGALQKGEELASVDDVGAIEVLASPDDPACVVAGRQLGDPRPRPAKRLDAPRSCPKVRTEVAREAGRGHPRSL